MNYSDFVIRSCRKTPNSMAEAFKTDDWCVAITKPKESEYSVFWSVLGVLTTLALVAYLIITRF